MAVLLGGPSALPAGRAVVMVTNFNALDPARWAVRYAVSGLPVLPLHSARDGRCTCGDGCGRQGKHPLTRHGKDDASTDPERVARWWARWPWANIGIRPPAGVVVLDVDPRNGGAEALCELIRQYGPLPSTLTARTGGGGFHIWLAYAGRARGQLCCGVDVKTDGGYLVCPPSVHVSRRRYEWAARVPTAPAPTWLRRLLAPPRPAPKLSLARSGGGLDPLLRFLAAAPEGRLNNSLFWAASRAHDDGLDVGPLVELAVSMGHPRRGAEATAGTAGDRVSRQVVRR
ncbi:MAG TPA: bifunctional DNA primase/polymerase [Pseudonocardiaceae bacterium]|nr:bifunctional DNA primase/polymerase [Pseudonocardiaceae bacterium]